MSLLRSTFLGCLTANSTFPRDSVSHLKSFNNLFSASIRQGGCLVFVTKNCEWFRNWNEVVAGPLQSLREAWDVYGTVEVLSGLVVREGNENPTDVVNGSCHDLAKQLIKLSPVLT